MAGSACRQSCFQLGPSGGDGHILHVLLDAANPPFPGPVMWTWLAIGMQTHGCPCHRVFFYRIITSLADKSCSARGLHGFGDPLAKILCGSVNPQIPLLAGPAHPAPPRSLHAALSSFQVPESFLPPVPITAPIMTPLSDPQAQLQQPPTSAPPPTQVPFQPSHLPPGQPGLQNPFQNVPSSGVQTIMTPSVSASSMEGAPGAPTGNTMQHMQSLPTEKITKKPIPEEHLILKTTFEALIQRCLSSATDPQTKRKLDDANKRLEFLYDKLRDQTLSPMIINGLHNIARSIETRNYTEGLNIHTHIVSTSNFSETSAFMPVLKVVLTQANKLGV